MPTDALAAEPWLDEFGRRLPRHAAVLRRMVDLVHGDRRVVQLLVGCSVARGVADEFSDLDCHLTLEDVNWPSGLDMVEPLVRGAGDVVDMLHHQLAESGERHRHTSAQFADGVQLSLMVTPVTAWSGIRPPDVVILFERRAIFLKPWDPGTVTATLDSLREWCFLGWWALLDAEKYLRRGSAWEARQRVEEARAVVWRMVAMAQKLPFAQFGLTAVLDADSPAVPLGLEATAVDLAPENLHRAVRACADQLHALWAPAAAAVTVSMTGRSQEPRIAGWALSRLASI